MNTKKRIARLLKATFDLKSRFREFTDIRKNPTIKLQTILMSLFLMPFFAVTSLLGLDRENRTSAVKRLFGCRGKMVGSDSTFRRLLGWLQGHQIRAFVLSFLAEFEQQDLLRRQLVPSGPLRRLGILDGSHMGSHWVLSLCLSGAINFAPLIRRYANQGQELSAAYQLIAEAPQLLGESTPELWLCDAKYFTKNTFDLVRAQHSQLLIKLKDAEYREVTTDAQNLFEHFGGDREASGFDAERMCRWSIKQTTGRFAGHTVQVLCVEEFYPKRKKDQHVRFWIVTTDLSLSLEELREAAHRRWQIENNLFKRLSHLSGTKRFYFKDPRPFFNLLHLFCAAVAVLDALISTLRHQPQVFKHVLDGIKPTWRNIFSQLKEVCLKSTFRFV